jgi:hypothetical protein
LFAIQYRAGLAKPDKKRKDVSHLHNNSLLSRNAKTKPTRKHLTHNPIWMYLRANRIADRATSVSRCQHRPNRTADTVVDDPHRRLQSSCRIRELLSHQPHTEEFIIDFGLKPQPTGVPTEPVFLCTCYLRQPRCSRSPRSIEPLIRRSRLLLGNVHWLLKSSCYFHWKILCSEPTSRANRQRD